MALSGSFISATGQLSVFGDAAKNTITLSRDAAGRILINGGAVPIIGGTATVANTTLIQVFGLAGDDIIAIDETNGAMPKAQLFGGDGNDVLTGGSGDDLLFGQAGNDTILGKGGNDLLFGGDGDDTLTGGVGSDQVFGQGGNDRMIWNPGEGSDLFEGGDGIDTAEVNGGNGAEVFNITANGTRVLFDRSNPAPFTIDIGTTENLVLNANGGDDVITAGNGLASLIKLTIDGGTGNDTITGGDGDDLLIGGDGNDVINGGRGADTALLGAGDDTFVWNPGDGSDVVEGQAGNDTLIFNGSNANENISISANGARTKLFRDVGNVTMDLNGMETIQVAALGGADTITVGDLTGTGVTRVAVDLASPPGSGTGDAQADTVIVNGTAGGNHVTVTTSGSSIVVSGLPAQVTITGAESANDSLVINALGGNDTIDASALVGNPIRLTIDGGDGNDTITGGDGSDMLIGGAGNDTITGGRGNDVALMGDGNDTFIWNPGEGSDTVEGQAGTDRLVFNGANVNENMDISANGGRARLFRDVGNVTMDLNGIETIQLAAAGGADTITVNDLTGTDVTLVAIDLAAPQTTSGDGQPDRVVVNGTAGDDAITIVQSRGMVTVNGLAARVAVANAEGANDSLVINGLGGNDTINAASLASGVIALTLNGGDGDDIITGSQGDDIVNGGRGNDTAFLGKGNDTFVWNPGDGSDVVEGQTGTDTLVFNGSNVAENMDISANGSRVRLFRDVGNVTMDLNSVEHIQLAALGGADTITVNDLTGTGVTQVAIDLSGVPGSGTGDGQSDTIVVNGTAGSDVISVTNNNGVVTISGLATDVTITGFEPTDHIVINGLGGDDVILGSGLGTSMLLTENGGDGADVLIGSDGNDTLSGGAGDDILIGGAGQDILDGGPGDNILLQAIVAGSPDRPGATAGSDVITVSVSNGAVTERGAAGTFTVPHQDGSNGPVVINGLGGDDIIDASSVPAGQVNLTFIGGSGNDVILASQGDDSIMGGTGDDTFVFNGGHHVIQDFRAHGAGIHGDIVALVNFPDHTFDQAVADGHIAQSAAGVIVSDGTNNMVTMQNVSLASLGARDFRFS